MGNVVKIPERKLPIETIAQELLDERKNIRTLIVAVRDKDGELTVQCYGPDGNLDDLLQLKQAVKKYVDDTWDSTYAG